MTASAINLSDFQRESAEDLERRGTILEAEAQILERQAIELGCQALQRYGEAAQLYARAARLRMCVGYSMLTGAAE